MVRRASVAVCSPPCSRSRSAAAFPTAAPVRLARHPDYHGGKIVFSYLGDIWIANEDGAERPAAHRQPRARGVSALLARRQARSRSRRTATATTTCSSSRRPAARRRRLTYHTGNDDVVGWTRDSQQVIFRSARGDGAFPNVATLYQVAVGGGQEQPLPVDWGYWGSFSPDGKSLVFNRHPATWSRKHYRGSYAADLWIADLAAKTYTQAARRRAATTATGRCGAPTARSTSSPIRCRTNAAVVSRAAPRCARASTTSTRSRRRAASRCRSRGTPSGSLFWPSMSSDGKVIVYEDKLRHLEARRRDRARRARSSSTSPPTRRRTNSRSRPISNEVDAFDLSPSGRRAVISARGQILTIATERGDITRVAPDKMASRNQAPKWSPDGKFLAFVSDRSGRDEIWISDPEGRTPKKITDLDNEKGAIVWTPDSKSLLYTAADKKLYSYSVADGKTAVVASSDVGRIGIGRGVARQQVDRVLEAGSDASLARLHRADRGRRGAPHLRRPPALLREPTPCGPPTAATWSSRRRKARATASRRRAASARRWRCGRCRCAIRIAIRRIATSTTRRRASRPKRRRGRTPAAAAAAARRPRRRGAHRLERPRAARAAADGARQRARRPDAGARRPLGRADGRRTAAARRRRAAAPRRRPPASTSSTSRAASSRACRRRRRQRRRGRGGGGRGGGGGCGGGSSMAFARDGRTLYFRSGTGLYAAPINPAARRRRRAPAAAAADAAGAAAAAAAAQPGSDRTGGDARAR